MKYLLLAYLVGKVVCVFIRPEQGVSSVTQDIAEALCFIPRNITAGPFQSKLQYDSTMTTESMYDMLQIESRTGGGFGPFRVEASSSYMRSTEESSLSLSVHYFAKYWRDIYVDHPYQVDENLTEEGKIILGYGMPEFRTYCGDRFITSFEEGAMLIYTVKFTFSKKSEKRLFQASISASVPFFSASSSFTELFEKHKVQGTLSVSAHQVGGEPALLGSALTTPVSFTDLAGCKAVLDGLHAYSENFSQQIDIERLEAEPLGTLHILGPYKTSSVFTEHQIYLGESPVTPEINKAREWLALIKKDLDEDLDNLEMLKSQGFTRVSPEIEEEIEITKHNLRLLEFGLRYGPMAGCWYNLDYCLDIAREIKENLLPSKFDPKTIPLCNSPQSLGLSAHASCVTKAWYKTGATWEGGDGTYRDEIRIPAAGESCIAFPLGDFARRRYALGFIHVGTTRWRGPCWNAAYAPTPDPENEYNWKKDRPERVYEI